MTTPALLRLREALPETRITLLTPAKLAGLWTHHPAVDHLLTFGARDGAWSVARQLRQAEFDVELVLPNSTRSALEGWLAGIPERIGFPGHWRRFLLTRLITPGPDQVPMRKRSVSEIHRVWRHPAWKSVVYPPGAHHLHHYLRLAAALGGNPAPVPPLIAVTDAEIDQARTRFGLADPTAEAEPWVGLNPGAEYGPAKRWPLASFVAAAQALQRQRSCRWMILGGPADRDLGAALEMQLTAALKTDARPPAPAAAVTIRNLAGATTLRELAAVLKICRALLTNDTGPMHLAAAVGTPVVVPFGSTVPALTGPGLPGDPRHRLLTAPVPCAPCFRRDCPVDLPCLHGITAEDAVNALLPLVK